MLYNRNSTHVECEEKSGTSNNSSNCNHLKPTQTTPEQLDRKARDQGTEKTAILGTVHILRKVLM